MGVVSWNPRRQGDMGEVSAISWLISVGAVVSLPLFHSPDYDLIADFDGRIERIQVKTSVAWHNRRFIVAICTRGGNRSWNGVIKRLDASRCDSLFVHVGTAGAGSSPRSRSAADPESHSAGRSTPSTK